MPNPVNLANVNISIQQFQHIASGKYNAGEVSLASETSLGKINNQVHFRGDNEVPMPHAEVLAIKDAFIRALSQNGVGIDEINRVRRELGLAPDGAVDLMLAKRNIRPLTRQQVREILDRNAATINGHNNDQQIIRTDEQLHARYSERRRAHFVSTRNEVNAEMMHTRRLLPDLRIVDIQRVIGGAVYFTPDEDRERLITVAQRQKDAIVRRSNGNPSNDPNATISYPHPDTGQNLTFSLGMSEADYVRRLDDMLILLKSDNQPSQAALDVRAEYRAASAAGNARVAELVAGLANDPQGGFKARTIAVSLLFERGVDDWATLSLVNKVSDFAAISLVSYLANNAGELMGDALRQSPAVAALAGQLEPEPIPAERQAYIPALSPQEANAVAVAGLKGFAGKLTHEMKSLQDTVLSRLRARFGEAAVPANATFDWFVTGRAVDAAFANAGNVRKTADMLVQTFVDTGSKEAARRLVGVPIKAILEPSGSTLYTAGCSSVFVKRHPDVAAALANVQSPEEGNALLEQHRPAIQECVRRYVTSERCKASTVGWYREAIAQAMGVPVTSLEGREVSVNRLTTKANNLLLDISSGLNPANTDQEIEQAFRNLAQAAAQERIALMRQVDEMQLLPETRDILKAQVLVLGKVSGFDLTALKNAADAISVSKLCSLLSADAPTGEIVAAMSEVGSLVSDAALAVVNGHGNNQDVGGDEIGTAANLIVTLAVDKEHRMFELLRAFFMRPEVMAANSLVQLDTGIASRAVAFELFKPREGVAETNAAIADSIGRPNAAPLVAQALNLAFDDLGIGGLPAEEKSRLLGDPGVGGAIAHQVRTSAKPVTPSQIRAIARIHLVPEAARRAVDHYVCELARKHTIDASDVSGYVCDILTGRDPRLLADVQAAVSYAAARGENPHTAANAVLARHEALSLAALRALGTIRDASASARGFAVREIAERANLDEALVRAKLDSDGLRDSFNFLRADVVAALSNPATNLATWNQGAVEERAARCIETFVRNKVAFLAEVDGLPVSDAAKGSLVVATLREGVYKGSDMAAAAGRILQRPEIVTAMQFAKNMLAPEKVAQQSDDDLFMVFETVGAKFNEAIEAELPAERRAQMNQDDNAVIRSLLAAALVDFCGDRFLLALSGLASAGRIDSLNAVGSAEHRRYSSQRDTYQHGIDDKGNMVPADPDKALAAGKGAAAASLGMRLLDAGMVALDDAWLPAEIADAVNSNTETEEQKALAFAAVRRAPALFEKYAEGLDENQRAELKSFVITLDYRDAALEASESAIKVKALSFFLGGAGFDAEGSPAAAKALQMGYVRGELPMLQQVAEIYRQATGCTEAEARATALDPFSPARRLFSYGGRFTASPDAFRKGLALMESFKGWFAAANAKIDPKRSRNGRLPEGAGVTAVNANTSYFKPDTERAFERFLFQEIAFNNAIPLEAEDPESIFGMEANAATRAIGRGFSRSLADTLAQIPPDRRSVLYAVFDILSPLGATMEEAKANALDIITCIITTRVMRHYDEVLALKTSGRLTRESIFGLLFPDVDVGAAITNTALRDYFNAKILLDILPNRLNGDPSLMGQVGSAIQISGVTLDEAVDAVLAGQPLPPAPYVAGTSIDLAAFDGTAKGGRKIMLADLNRPASPTYVEGDQPVIDAENCVYTVVFPDGTTLKSVTGSETSPAVREASGAIDAKVAELCGEVHPAQLGTVYGAMSQSGAAPVKERFVQFGINASEHMPLVFTLTKNAETGAITVRYSEPEGFPVHFHWENTIATDGTSVVTEMVIEQN